MSSNGMKVIWGWSKNGQKLNYSDWIYRKVYWVEKSGGKQLWADSG